MNPPIVVVDAFTHRPYGGNPAAVCVLDAETDDAWMQAVAAEMNLSETAFLVPRDSGEWSLRWFTPRVEVSLCGHATLASAHALWTEFNASDDILRFHTRSGVLSAERAGNRIFLDFPSDPPTAVDSPPGLFEALGVDPSAVRKGREDLLVVLENAEQLRTLAPDFNRLASIETRGVCVTAPGSDAGFDFLSRFFGPRVGINEDPVTGSAHCLLAPYWGAILGKREMVGFQASARGGEVGVELQDGRVRLSGRAVTTLRGELRA